MAILKCKMCGGDFNICETDKVVECDYCGTKQTVPSADSEKKLNLFNRANRLRINGEFDKAAGIYESIVAEFPEEAEGYWGLTICNYGIEYVDDPATGNKIPTCHRASFEPISNDENFKMALEFADVVAQKVYRDEAREIDRIREEILSVSKNEKPYDIFICYKETAENGERTIDSVIAQDVYDALTAKGYRVFFARISLEDKLGRQYEPYIFAALNSAKVMLSFGTKYEYFHAVWVKNEWSRFLKLMAKDKSKVLIPCYKDMDAYDMPDEFKAFQAQDMGKIGAAQDLLRGIDKILKTEKNETSVSNVNVNATVTCDTLLERAYILLRDGDFQNAENYFDKVLERSPKESKAYWGKFLCKEKCIDNVELTGNIRVLDFYKRCIGTSYILNVTDVHLADVLIRQFGNEYAHALAFANDEDKNVYQGCFDNVIEQLKILLHDAQDAEKRCIEEAANKQKLENEKKERELAIKRELEAQAKKAKNISSVFCGALIIVFGIILFKVPQIKDFIIEGISDKAINYIVIQGMLVIFSATISGICHYGKISWPAIPVGALCAIFNIASFVWTFAKTGYFFGAAIATFFIGIIGLGISVFCGMMIYKAGSSN